VITVKIYLLILGVGDMCIFVLCLIVVLLPPGKFPFAVKLNNNNNITEEPLTYTCVRNTCYMLLYLCAHNLVLEVLNNQNVISSPNFMRMIFKPILL
jgi:hypothetical protein